MGAGFPALGENGGNHGRLPLRRAPTFMPLTVYPEESMLRLKRMLCLLLLLVLAACAAPAPPAAQTTAPTTAAVPPTSAPTVVQARPTTPPTAAQTTAPPAAPASATTAPTIAPRAAQAQASAEDNLQSGRLPGGEWFIGNPNAPVTVVDYSDFL